MACRRYSLGQQAEFVAKELRQWLAQVGCLTLYMEPGSPWENGIAKLQRTAEGRMLERRDLLFTQGGADRDR